MGWSGINLHLSKLKLSQGGQIYEFGIICMLHGILKTSLRQGKVQGRCFIVRSKPWHSGQKVDTLSFFPKCFMRWILTKCLILFFFSVCCDTTPLLSAVMILIYCLKSPVSWIYPQRCFPSLGFKLYDRWTILYEFLRLDMILRQYGCTLWGKGVTTPHLSSCESSDAFINICLKHLNDIRYDKHRYVMNWSESHLTGRRQQRISWAEAQRSICETGWQCHHQGFNILSRQMNLS